MRIFTYYENVPGINQFDSLRLVGAWREAWSSAGFDPICLSEWHARQHPYFEEYAAAVSKLPTVNHANYELSCYLRWLSMAQEGGGVLMDYDVFPLNVDIVNKAFQCMSHDRLTVFQNVNTCPSMNHGPANAYLDQCKKFAAYIPTQKDIEGGRPHTSDMLILEQQIIKDSTSFDAVDLVRCWGEVDKATTGAIHFSNGSMAKETQPRWKRIPELLKP